MYALGQSDCLDKEMALHLSHGLEYQRVFDAPLLNILLYHLQPARFVWIRLCQATGLYIVSMNSPSVT